MRVHTEPPRHVLKSDTVNNAINVVLVKIMSEFYRKRIRAMSFF